jgi:hypothetical protein
MEKLITNVKTKTQEKKRIKKQREAREKYLSYNTKVNISPTL